jgi:hypothetical protein
MGTNRTFGPIGADGTGDQLKLVSLGVKPFLECLKPFL